MSLFTNSNAATLDLELLNKQTVKIEVGSEIGSGVLLCQNDDQINILTAKHIFDSSYETIQVEFYRDYCNPINLTKKELKIILSKTLDIALLQVKKVQSCTLKFIPIGTSKTIELVQDVHTTGHPIGESEFEWVFQPGKINSDVGEYITHSCRITNGYSGGPLVNDHGTLIGINVEVDGNTAQAIPIDSILPFLREHKIPIDVQTAKPVKPEEPESNKTTFRALDFLYSYFSSAKKAVFRHKPETLNGELVKSMLKIKGFYDSSFNKNASGFSNNFELKYNGLVVFDHATGLMWQQSGSEGYMEYEQAKDYYIKQLNQGEGFAGYHDWRLPTLEEAMSLMEPTQMNGDLYIDDVFDNTQVWIWTSDLCDDCDDCDDSNAWVVSFDYGRCFTGKKLNNTGHIDGSVRAVR